MMKPYLLPILLFLSYSGGILAQDSDSESPFISSTQTSVMAMSATTGFMVAMNYSPLLQAEQLRQLQFQASHCLWQIVALNISLRTSLVANIWSNK